VAQIVDVARDHASLLGGLGDRRPRARSCPWIPPPGSTLRSLSRKAGEEKGAKKGDDVQGPLASEGNRRLARRDMEEACGFIGLAHRAKRARAPAAGRTGWARRCWACGSRASRPAYYGCLGQMAFSFYSKVCSIPFLPFLSYTKCFYMYTCVCHLHVHP
jgi:hypothetical protein